MQNSGIAVWAFNPFIRILPALICGILIGVNLSIPFWLPLCLIILLSIFLVFPRKLYAHRLSRARKVFGILIFINLVCAGTLVEWLHNPANKGNWVGHNKHGYPLAQVRLLEDPHQTSFGFRAVAELQALVADSQKLRSTGRVFLYFNNASQLPVYGDELVVKNEPAAIRGAMNPGGFDFRKYAANKGVHYAFYIRDPNFRKVGSSPNWFVSLLNESRKKILKSFNQFFPEKEVRGIAAALLIGYREDLEKPLLQEYSDAGVVHVIAISGLHLGLIYVMLVSIFSKIRFLHRRTVIRCWMVLTFLWLFSLLTGGSASVLRSAVMFSCILIGETYFKKSGTWNVIAASAFLLLLYDPMLLYDAGFLLSYAAVAGIVAWQRPLYRTFYLRNKALRQIWNMSSVTITAQIAAFPLCLYYFHQFPNLFLFTNLIVVPLSTIILFGEVAFLILAPMPFINEAIAFLIRVLIRLMNGFVKWSNQIPFSSSKGIYADLFTTLLIFGIVICCTTFLLQRKRQLLLPAFIFVTTLSLYFFYLDVAAHRQNKIIFYHSSDGAVIDFFGGRTARYFSFSKSDPGGRSPSFILPARMTFRIRQEEHFSCQKDPSQLASFLFAGVRTIVISRPLKNSYLLKPVAADYLLITGNPTLNMSELVRSIHPALIIFCSSNSPMKIAQWKRECELLHLRSFSIRDNGALVISLHPAARIAHLRK